MLLLPGGEEEEETMTMEKKAITMSSIPMFGYHQFVRLKLVEHIRDSLSADYPDKKRDL